MPLKKGKSQKVISQNIRELHKGKTFERTSESKGIEVANRQAIAIALGEARKSK